MRRGRIFIYLALIIIVGVAGAALYWWKFRPAAAPPPAVTQTPQVRYVGIVTAGQNIYPGTIISEAMLSSIQIPEDKLVQGLFTNKADLVNKYAKYAITQGVPITDTMISTSPGNVNLPGSAWAPSIPQGLTAVSVPISRLSSMAFGIRDGDFVDVIVSMLLVDVDPATQTVLPWKVTNTGQSTTVNGATSSSTTPGVISVVSPLEIPQGHFEVDQVQTDPVSTALLYVYPPEGQRGRLVTQMLMQNVQVLHTGTFSLPGEPEQVNAVGAGAATPTPLPANQTQAAPVIVRPDIITLMVTPQDAVTLTYLMYSGAQINLSLRNPNDQTPISQPDAAMLEYLLTQYSIPVPAKLPYSLQPRLDGLQQPLLPNDITPKP
jgi:Flp pilus assembly protein CpaB